MCLCFMKTFPLTLSNLVFLTNNLKHLWRSKLVPRVHSSTEWGSQLFLWAGLLWHCTGHPSGAMGLRMKLWVPHMCAYAYTFGSTLDWRSMFKIRSAGAISLHHKCIGNVSCTPHIMLTKWLFAVWMLLSAMFRQWSWGDMSSYSIPFALMTFLYSSDALLFHC